MGLVLLTNHNATVQIIFMNMCPPSPRMAAYRGTNGCAPPKEKSVSASGWCGIRSEQMSYR